MRKALVLGMIMVLALALVAGCGGSAVTGSGTPSAAQDVATGVTVLKNALALAQVGYQDYALISGKSTNPQVQNGMALIDSQLNVLGALAYNVAQPAPADLASANAALAQVDAAKVQIAAAAAQVNPTPAPSQ